MTSVYVSRLRWLTDWTRKVTALLAFVVWLSTAIAAESWFLWSRHGECAEVTSLKRKVPDLGAVRDPESFEKLMRDKGHQVTVKEVAMSQGRAVEILVPARELSVIFVTADVCDQDEQRQRIR